MRRFQKEVAAEDAQALYLEREGGKTLFVPHTPCRGRLWASLAVNGCPSSVKPPDAALCPLPLKVKELDVERGTTKWQTVRRQKREWIKFAAACREGEDNSKRNPIARVSGATPKAWGGQAARSMPRAPASPLTGTQGAGAGGGRPPGLRRPPLLSRSGSGYSAEDPE